MRHSQISTLPERKLPTVAIIGRPNVGKSTLFNRLIGKRRSITDPTPGVTRDPIGQKWFLQGNPVLLIDSGGVKLDQEGLDYVVTQKSLELLKDADAIIFLMEVTEVTAEDQMLIQTLRPFSDKTILAVNKVDNPMREDLVWDYHRWGYQRVVGISSAHGIGIEELEEHLLTMLDLVEIFEDEEQEEAIHLAILGKPNTGKSTLTNMLTGKETSIVSDIPGTTRDVVIGSFAYKNNRFHVLDTAGIRRKSKIEEDVEYYSVNRAIKSIDEADVILLMVDVIEGLSEQDKKIAQLIVRRGKGIILILNKIDKLPPMGNQLQAISDRVRFLFPILSFAPMIAISALKGTDVTKMLDTVLSVHKQLNRRVETAVLNDHIQKWQQEYQIPRGSSGHVKMYYGTQVSAPPVRFLFFVNRKKDVPATYLQYLKNNVRRDLGFKDIPIEIELKERRRNAPMRRS